MKVTAFITYSKVVDRIINHLKLEFVADRPPPPHESEQVALLVAETGANYFGIILDDDFLMIL
jgi:hypothetical protein